MAQTFSEFKKDFYGRFSDLSIFDCLDFNLLKTVLDGLRVNYAARAKIRLFIFYPDVVISIIFFLKRLQTGLGWEKKLKGVREKIELSAGKRHVILDSCVSNTYVNIGGKYLPRYFNYIIESLGQDAIAYYQDQLPSDGIFFNLHFKDFENLVFYSALNAEDLHLMRELKKTLKSIKKLDKFTKEEFYNLKVATQLFFFQYRLYNFVFENTSAKNVFFNMHYHREGGLYALKKLRIKSIELQHGLIAEEDIFYVFPRNVLPVRDRCLFPDLILTFGEYWSEILKKGYEFSEEQIVKVGYSIYEYSGDEAVDFEVKNLANGRKVILITTQTSFHEFFCEYTIWLSDQIKSERENYVIFVKPHPSEKLENYSTLLCRPGIALVNYPLEYLFKHSSINISVYSTTLYDAVRYGIKSFALLKPGCEDYVHGVVSTGVAELLLIDENPLSKSAEAAKLDKTKYYDKFDHTIIKKLIA